jgi:hypothetical protein
MLVAFALIMLYVRVFLVDMEGGIHFSGGVPQYHERSSLN